jgi:outer membrane receptor protein involved in Fe transport
MYEDGMPVYESSALSFANIDTFYRVDDSVDVLEAVRGGSASIFASNSPGGLVNFISKTGGEAAEGSIRFTAGSYGLLRGDFNYGGPVGDDWRYNIGGFYRFDSGIRDPDFQANKGGQIRLNATRIFESGYVRFYFKALDEQNTFYLPIPLQDADNPKSIPGVNANFGTMTSLDAALVRVPTGDGAVRAMDLRDGVNPRVLSLGLEFFHELDSGWNIKNNARFTDIDLNYNAIFSGASPASTADYAADKLQQFNAIPTLPDATTAQYRYATSGELVTDPATLNGNGLALEYGWWNVQKPMSSFTNDLQVSRSFETNDLTLGLYFSTYRAEDFWQFNNILLEARNAPRLLDLEFLDAPGGNVVGTATQNGFTQYGSRYVRADNSATVVALYANDDWEITDRWRLDAGIRFETADYDGNTEATAQYDISASNPLSDPPAGQPAPPPTMADRNLQWGTGQILPYSWTFSDWAASVGANYRVSDGLAVYGRISSGFRQPTFDRWSVLTPGSTQITKGQSEDVRQAEAGVKMSTANLGLFAALFYSRLDNVVFNDEVLDGAGMLVPRNGEANTETPGAELEVVYRPSALWLLEGMLTLQQAKYGEFIQTTGGAPLDFSGNQVRRIPDVILNFRPTFQLGRFKAFLNWQHVGQRYSDDANTVKLPEYDKIDLGAVFSQSRTTYAVHVTNLFNEVGLTEGNPRSGQVVGTVTDVYLARPILGRALRLSVGYRF